MAMRVLVTGATGYVGGRLVPRLLAQGHRVRVLVRDAERVRGRPWSDAVEVVEGDLLEPATLPAALAQIDAAYYLVHAMGAGGDFAQRDRTAAERFADHAGHLRHVIYLGGLQPASGAAVSAHLRSRAEVGAVLRARLPTTEFRAGPVIGSGSASFEMVRYLTERLPVMVAPRWVVNPVHPIAVRDVLQYLLSALDREPMGVVPIGAEALTFERMMLIYAEQRGLRRVVVPVPVLAPSLAARWVGLVTPIPNKLAVPLIEGVIQPLPLPDDRARHLFPDIEPISYREAVVRALARTERLQVETRWSGALGAGPRFELTDREGLIREVRRVSVAASPEQVYATVSSLGGQRGWLVWNWAWWVRGLLDRLVGGPGLRRGRRHPTELLAGESVDWWRVEQADPPGRLRLRAEMKLPGRAWLQWQIEPAKDGTGTELVQTAAFEPRGLPGVLYWWSLYPMHAFMFTALVHAIARVAVAAPRDDP